MARGWESKSIEEQQSAAAEFTPRAHTAMTPAEAATRRHRDGLLLARKHVLEQLQLAHNPNHHNMLERALADLDARLAASD